MESTGLSFGGVNNSTVNPGGGLRSLRVSLDNYHDQYACETCAYNAEQYITTQTLGPIDLTSYTGIQFKARFVNSDPAPAGAFFVLIVYGWDVETLYYMYSLDLYTPTSTWTTFQIPFSALTTGDPAGLILPSVAIITFNVITCDDQGSLLYVDFFLDDIDPYL